MEYKSIYKNNDIFTAFPDPEEVFATDLEKSLLLPLGVYHLTDNGVHDILLAAPLGDEEGMIGKRNLKDRCSETWLSYSKKNGKWALECSLENFRSFDHYSENARKSLDEQKNQFQQNGFLSHPWGQVEKLSLFNTGGYASSKYNWYVDIRNEIRHRLVATKDSSKQVILIDESGHEYMYLGFVDASIYARPLLAQLHYFYSALSERVLVIHEFS